MNQEFYEAVEANPVIAAVKNDAGLQAAVEMEEIQVIFVLYGDVCTIPEILERIKAAGKKSNGTYRSDCGTQRKRDICGIYRQADKSGRDHHDKTGTGAAGKRTGDFCGTSLFCD